MPTSKEKKIKSSQNSKINMPKRMRQNKKEGYEKEKGRHENQAIRHSSQENYTYNTMTLIRHDGIQRLSL